MRKIDAIISDSDGTLVDTVDLIRHGQYETARQYLIKRGIPDVEIPNYDIYNDMLIKAIGGSARDTLERTIRLLYAAQPHHLEGMDFDELHDMLNPIQDRIAPEYVKAYEGLSEFLHGVGEAGIKLAIFTSGTPHHIVRNFGVALPELHLRDLYKDTTKSDTEKLNVFTTRFGETFSIPDFTVVTSDDTENHKPDPESLNLAMHRLGVAPENVAVLGDHKVDMQTAINAGVANRFGITHGFDDDETLLANGATRTVSSFSELDKLIK
jgi:phosphoglycolate phosphatase-like HAD superfamily hydrolase